MTDRNHLQLAAMERVRAEAFAALAGERVALVEPRDIELVFQRMSEFAATAMGDVSFEFKEKDYTMPEITFAAIGDPTQPRGRQLFRVIEEQ